jgi:hypothetical protein
VIFTNTSYCQQIGIGGIINHTSNGILLSFSPNISEKWSVDLGLRVMVNTYSINENKQQHIFFQTGYAQNIFQHFGLNIKGSRKLVGYKFIRLDVMANLLLTCHSRLIKSNLYIPDTITGNYHVLQDELYTKAAPAIELTLGPLLSVDLSKRLSVSACVGYGIIYMNYKNTAFSKVNNSSGQLINASNPNRARGYEELVGGDVLPMINLNCKYKLH